MTPEERLTQLLQKAQAAIDRGANPDKVHAYLESWASKNGIENASFNLKPTEVANQSPSFSDVEAGSVTSAKPSFDNIKSGVESTAEPEFLDSAWAGLKGVGKKAAAGGLLALEGARSIVDPIGSALDEDSIALQGAATLQESANEDLKGAHGWGGALGGLPAGIVGAPFLIGSAGMDELDKGKSLVDAELALARQGLITELSIGAGMLGSQAKGLLPWLSRAGAQAPAGVALTAADRALRGEDIAPDTDEAKREYILGLGGGLFGSVFRNPTKAKVPTKKLDISTGDADIDAGIADFKKVLGEEPAPKKGYDVEARRKAQEDILADMKAPEQGDLFSPQRELQGGLFGDAVPADLVEARRLSAERASRGEEPTRTQEQIRDLETDYIMSQQERLDKGTHTEDMVSTRGDIPEAYLGIAKQDVLPEGNRTIFTRDGELVGVRDIQPNTQMQREMLLALAERGKLRNDPTPIPAEESTQGTLFEPSKNEIAEQVVEQGDLLGGTQQDLQFKNADPFEGIVAYQPKAKGAIEQKIEAKKVAQAAPSIEDLRSKIAAMKGAPKVDEAPGIASIQPLYRASETPARWTTRTQRGALSVGEMLDDVVKGTIPSLHPEVVNYAKYLQALGKKFGGLDVMYKAFDETDPDHAAYLAQRALEKAPAGAGYYDRAKHSISINPDEQSIHTFLHEGTHAITVKALEAGAMNKLTGDAKLAFNRLNTLHKEVTPLLKEIASSDSRAKTLQTYGTTNLYEFIAELYTNPAFRAQLKKLQVPESEARMTETGRVRSTVARDMYAVVVKNLRKLLGLPEKAETMLDLAISTGHEFFQKASPAEANAYRGSKGIHRLENTVEEPKLQKSLGKVGAGARELLLSKGNVPEVNDATRSVQGAVNAARAVSTTTKNLVESERSSVNPEDAKAVLEGRDDGTAMARLKEQSPDVAKAVEAFQKRRIENSLEIVEQKLRDPNLTENDRATLDTILNKANNYLTTTRQIDEIKTYGKDTWKKYKAGDEKAAEIVQGVKNYLSNRFLDKDVDKMGMDALSEVYETHTGVNPEAQFAGMPREQKKLLMQARVSEAIQKIANKDQWLDNNVQALLGIGDTERNAIARWYKQARLGSNVLSTKTKIPPALEKLWGRVEDPFFQMYRTIEEQASQLAQIKAQNVLREDGLKSGLFTEKPDTASHTVQLSGESLGPLQGLYTTPDAADAVMGIRAISGASSDLLALSTVDKSGQLITNAAGRAAFNGVGAVAGLNKAATILGNVGNFPLNLAGSPMQLASNGNYNPASWAAGAKLMGELVGVGSKRKLSKEAERAFRLNLAEVSQTQELMSHPRSVELKKFLDEMSGQTNPAKWLYAQGKEGLKLFHELYGAMDLWTKLANFDHEFKFWKNQKTGMDDAALERFVANRINNSNITPSNSPLALRVSERLGGTMFGTYYAQVLKNTGYNIAYGGKDLLDGIKAGNTSLALHGAKRLSGVAIYMAGAKFLYGAAGKGLASVLGLAAADMSDDDPRKKYMQEDDFLSSMEGLKLTDPNKPEAGEYLMDVGRPNPFGPAVQISDPFIKAIGLMSEGKQEEAEKQAKLAVKNAWNLVNNNTIYKTASKIAKGYEPAMARTAPKAYNTEGVGGIETLSQEGLQEIGLTKANADRILNLVERFTPRTVLNIDKAKEVPEGTKLRQLVAGGVGVTKFNVGDDIKNYLSRGLKKDLSAARKPYMDILKSDVSVNEKNITDAFVDGMKELAEPYKKMETAVEAAKAQGLGRVEIASRMVQGDLSKEVAGMFYAGKPVPIALILGDPATELKKQIADAPADKRAELIERAKNKIKILSALYKKYEKVTLEDLENM